MKAKNKYFFRIPKDEERYWNTCWYFYMKSLRYIYCKNRAKNTSYFSMASGKIIRCLRPCYCIILTNRSFNNRSLYFVFSLFWSVRSFNIVPVPFPPIDSNSFSMCLPWSKDICYCDPGLWLIYFYHKTSQSSWEFIFCVKVILAGVLYVSYILNHTLIYHNCIGSARNDILAMPR